MKSLYFLIFLICTAVYCKAQKPGTIDKSYGSQGTGTITYQDIYGATSIAIQKDNKILTGSGTYNSVYTLIRRNIDGTLDSSFGTNGQTITNIDDLRKNIDFTGGWSAIAVAPDGKIVTLGTVTWYNPNYPPQDESFGDVDVVIARFLPDGTPDNSFGNKGRTVTNLGYMEEVSSLALQPDGKILVAGSEIRDMYDNTYGMLIMRYNSNGTLDKQFGDYKGYTLYNKTYGDYGDHVQLQADGRIVVGGFIAGDESFIFVRFLPTGLVDNSYGVNGYVETKLGAHGGGTTMADMALDSKGRIVATGQVGSFEGTIVTRYLTNGNLDSTFDEDGKKQLYFNNFPALTTNTLLLQPHNKIVISCYTLKRTDKYFKQALIGLNENGSLDNSFGDDKGNTITDISTYGEPYPFAVMQNDGKIVTLNTQPDEFPYDSVATLYLTRFNGYARPASSFNSEVTKEGIGSIKGKSASSIQVHPNPARTYVIVTGLPAGAGTTITITDALGKTTATYTTNTAAQYRVDLSKLTAGIYYLQANAGGKTETIRFIKE